MEHTIVKTDTALKGEDVRAFITSLVIAVSNCALYSRGHEAFDEFTKKCFSLLQGILKDRLAMMVIDNELIINSNPLREGVHISNLIARFKRKGISRIDILPGVTLNEIRQLIADIAETGKTMKSYAHIKTGTVDIQLSNETENDVAQYSSLIEIEKVKGIFHSSIFKQLDIKGLEEVVLQFIAAFKKESNILKYLSPIRANSDYTYTHATNVAVLSVFQAESLGISQELLYEIGIAALLHDAGKMFISKDILEKNGKLDDKEFAEIKMHPLRGAWYLAKIPGLTRLASIIAFEHHMKYDGTGYPEASLNGGKQHIFSQIVAVADFFDALRSTRPYRGGMDVKEIFVLMKKGAGKDFNPFLADNFISLMHSVLTK